MPRWVACFAHMTHTGCKCTCGDKEGKGGQNWESQSWITGTLRQDIRGYGETEAKVRSPYSPVCL